jgi:hypothetical protein
MMPWEKPPEPGYNEIPDFLKRFSDGALVCPNPLNNPPTKDPLALQLWGPKT